MLRSLERRDGVLDLEDYIRSLVEMFGPGTPYNLLTALYHRGTRDLHAIVNSIGLPPEQRWDVESFQIDRPRRRILYAVNEAGYTRLHALDARTGKALALPRLPPAD